MPTSTRGDKLKFYYDFGDYNNNLKTLAQTQISNTTLLVLLQIDREHPIVFRQDLQDTLAPYLWCTHMEEILCYLTQELSYIFSQTHHLFIARDSAQVETV